MADANGLLELVRLKRMVVAWKESYLRSGPAESAELVAREFWGELDEYIYPYLRRLRETGYIDNSNWDDFWEFCRQQWEELIQAVEGGCHA